MEQILRIKILDAIILDCCEDRLFWLFNQYDDARVEILSKSDRPTMRACNKCGIECCKEITP